MENQNTSNTPTAKALPSSSGSVLGDATKSETSMKGQALLQWEFHGSFPRRSLQMPEEVVDQILAWRDQAQNNANTNALFNAGS